MSTLTHSQPSETAKQNRSLPKGRVMHTELPRLFSCIPQTFHQQAMPKDAYSRGFPVAILPTATRKQAQQIVRWANLSREQKRGTLIKLFFYKGSALSGDDAVKDAEAVLNLLEGDTT